MTWFSLKIVAITAMNYYFIVIAYSWDYIIMLIILCHSCCRSIKENWILEIYSNFNEFFVIFSYFLLNFIYSLLLMWTLTQKSLFSTSWFKIHSKFPPLKDNQIYLSYLNYYQSLLLINCKSFRIEFTGFDSWNENFPTYKQINKIEKWKKINI